MRKKTIQDIVEQSLKYVIETLEIERGLQKRKIRDGTRAELSLMTGLIDDVSEESIIVALEKEN